MDFGREELRAASFCPQRNGPPAGLWARTNISALVSCFFLIVLLLSGLYVNKSPIRARKLGGSSFVEANFT